MIDLNEIAVNYDEVIAAKDAAPIWYIKAKFKILTRETAKGKRTFTTHVSNPIVGKGTIDEMKASKTLKRRVLGTLYPKRGDKAKILKFDLSKVFITDIEIIRHLSYEVKPA